MHDFYLFALSELKLIHEYDNWWINSSEILANILALEECGSMYGLFVVFLVTYIFIVIIIKFSCPLNLTHQQHFPWPVAPVDWSITI